MTEYDGELPDPARGSTGGPAPEPTDEQGDDGNRVGTVVIEWDGDDWEIPEKVTIDFARALAAWNKDTVGDPDLAIAVLRELLAPDVDQMESLNLTGQTGLVDLVEILNGLLKAASKRWGTGNFKNSSKPQRSTGRR